MEEPLLRAALSSGGVMIMNSLLLLSTEPLLPDYRKKLVNAYEFWQKFTKKYLGCKNKLVLKIKKKIWFLLLII